MDSWLFPASKKVCICIFLSSITKVVTVGLTSVKKRSKFKFFGPYLFKVPCRQYFWVWNTFSYSPLINWISFCVWGLTVHGKYPYTTVLCRAHQKSTKNTGFFHWSIYGLINEFVSAGSSFYISLIKWECFEKAHPLRYRSTVKK